jgi:hypothetical protein
MDNIKTKLQTQSIKSSCEKFENLNLNLDKNCDNNNKNKVNKNESEIKYKNIASTIGKIYKENGIIKGFFKGLTPRVLSNSPACAISWGTYEIIKHSLITSFKPNINNNNK